MTTALGRSIIPFVIVFLASCARGTARPASEPVSEEHRSDSASAVISARRALLAELRQVGDTLTVSEELYVTSYDRRDDSVTIVFGKTRNRLGGGGRVAVFRDGRTRVLQIFQ